jgi:hypothetical protein
MISPARKLRLNLIGVTQGATVRKKTDLWAIIHHRFVNFGLVHVYWFDQARNIVVLNCICPAALTDGSAQAAQQNLFNPEIIDFSRLKRSRVQLHETADPSKCVLKL